MIDIELGGDLRGVVVMDGNHAMIEARRVVRLLLDKEFRPPRSLHGKPRDEMNAFLMSLFITDLANRFARFCFERAIKTGQNSYAYHRTLHIGDPKALTDAGKSFMRQYFGNEPSFVLWDADFESKSIEESFDAALRKRLQGISNDHEVSKVKQNWANAKRKFENGDMTVSGTTLTLSDKRSIRTLLPKSWDIRFGFRTLFVDHQTFCIKSKEKQVDTSITEMLVTLCRDDNVEYNDWVGLVTNDADYAGVISSCTGNGTTICGLSLPPKRPSVSRHLRSAIGNDNLALPEKLLGAGDRIDRDTVFVNHLRQLCMQ